MQSQGIDLGWKLEPQKVAAFRTSDARAFRKVARDRLPSMERVGPTDAPRIIAAPAQRDDTDGMNLTRMILDGVDVRVRGQDVHMPAFGHAYSDAEVAALANYVIAQFGNKQGRVTPALVAERRKQ